MPIQRVGALEKIYLSPFNCLFSTVVGTHAPVHKETILSKVSLLDRTKKVQVNGSSYINAADLLRSCKVVYSQDLETCAQFCESILANIKAPTVVGFDLEWKPQPLEGGKNASKNKVAVVQICSSFDHSYVFHLAAMSYMPRQLRNLLENENVIKTGISIKTDLIKLQHDFNVQFEKTHHSYLELAFLAKILAVNPEKRGDFGLNSLFQHLFQKRLQKPRSVKLSNWESVPLSTSQINYAAGDAFVSFLMYCCLKDVYDFNLHDVLFEQTLHNQRKKKFLKQIGELSKNAFGSTFNRW
ncbi:unnamed protein product [Clavelina lepadiformis]|uniref:3'-5' exonuclease n=1 Tax=Clavelina lepadiformis TaxID=159417 RepID=A0ABP0GZL8_CLALP